MKKMIIVIFVVISLAGGGYYWFVIRSAKAANASTPKYTTETLETGNLQASISAIGKVRSRQSVDLSWSTSGKVEIVSVSAGQKVQAGQELARLSESSLPQNVVLANAEVVKEQKALADLHNSAEKSRIKAMQDIVTYQQAVRDAQYTLDNFTVPTNQKGMDTVQAVNAMEALLDQTRIDFEPYRYLSEYDQTREDRLEALNLAQADYNTAIKRLSYEYDLEVAQNNLDQALADYEKWKAGPDPDDIKETEARIAAQELILAGQWIEAPFAGTVTTVSPLVGDKVAQNTAAFRIDDLSKLLIDVEVSEIDISQVQIGQPATLTFDALRGSTYEGVVSQVAMIGVESSGVVNYIVTVELINPDEQVRPGMTAEVEVVVAERKNILLIPNQALKMENGQQIIQKLNPDGSLKSVPVELGFSSDLYTELLSGDLQPGMAIVVYDADESTTTQFGLGGGGFPGPGGDR